MDFTQKKQIPHNEKNYKNENIKICRNFSKKLIDELGDLVKSIVLFGSNATNTQRENSDIDILIILDNISVFVSDELRESYKIITKQLNNKVANGKIHLLTINLSDFYDMSKKSDPILINILRYGTPIFDTDLFEAHQYLLNIGKIKPTIESINLYKSRANTLFDETKKHLEVAILDLYYAVVDIVHSSLMVQKIIPPSPKEMPKIFKETFKKQKSIYMLYPIISEIYDKAKEIEHRVLDAKVDGRVYNKYYVKAKKIVDTLNKFIENEMKKRDLTYY